MRVGESRRGGLTRYLSKRVYAGGHALLRSTVVLRYIIISGNSPTNSLPLSQSAVLSVSGNSLTIKLTRYYSAIDLPCTSVDGRRRPHRCTAGGRDTSLSTVLFCRWNYTGSNQIAVFQVDCSHPLNFATCEFCTH